MKKYQISEGKLKSLEGKLARDLKRKRKYDRDLAYKKIKTERDIVYENGRY